MLSIVIPVFNEEKLLHLLHGRLKSASEFWEEEFEVLLVDDGSTDNTPEIIKSIADQDARFKNVILSRNFGQQAAISAGMEIAKGDAVIIMDGDLQDTPEELQRFIKKWKEGYDVVYAIRTERKERLLKRIAYSTFYKTLNVLSDINIPLDSGDFCLMDRKVVDVLNNSMPENIRFVRGLRAYAGFKQTGIECVRSKRAAGEPKYTLSKQFKLALDGIFGFSTFPLRIATYFGFILSIPSFLIGLFFIVHRIFNFKVLGHLASDVPGIASLAVGIFFLGGINLIILGVIGEYIGRMYNEVKKRPNYIISSVYSKENSL